MAFLINSMKSLNHKQKMFLEIDESIHVDPDISLWHWIYIYDQG